MVCYGIEMNMDKIINRYCIMYNSFVGQLFGSLEGVTKANSPLDEKPGNLDFITLAYWGKENNIFASGPPEIHSDNFGMETHCLGGIR